MYTIQYPGAIPIFISPTATDYMDIVLHADQHDKANGEISAIAAYLGTNAGQTTPGGANRVLNSTSGTAGVWTPTPTLTSLTLAQASGTALQLANAGVIASKDSGGTPRAMLQIFTDNRLYLDGVPATHVQIFRPDASTQTLVLDTGAAAAVTITGGLNVGSGGLSVSSGVILNTGSNGSTAYGLGTSNMFVGSYAANTGTVSVDAVVGDVNSATVNGNVARITGLLGRVVSVINGGQTLTRQASIYGSAPSSTVTGTLSNNNTLFLETPTSGTTIRVIDSSSGAFLTTGGIWTNNPSWERLKESIRPATEVGAWLDYLATEYEPVWYRLKPQYEEHGRVSSIETGLLSKDGTPLLREVVEEPAVTVMDQDYEHDHFGFVLDPIHEKMPSLFEAMTNDPSGALSTKDTEGVLLAMVANLSQRVKELEAASKH